MSYILEAIRKSEAQRQKSHPKPVRLLHAQQQKQTSWSRWLFVAVVALAAINIVTLAYFSQHSAPKSVNKASVSAVQEGVNPSEPEPVTAPALSQQRGFKNSAPVSVRGSALQAEKPLASPHAHPEIKGKTARTTPLPFPSASNLGFAQEGDKRASLRHSQTPSAKPMRPPLPSALDAPNDNIPRVVRPPESVAAAGPSASKEIPLFSELPNELRRRIPPIKVNVHAYSELPQEQFIIVDMIKYRSGERIAEGLMLEQVTPQGVVLRFEGTAFCLSKP